MKMKIFIGAFGLVLSSIVLPSSANSAEYLNYSASCTVSGTSTFTAARRGFYTYVWRTGSTVNGYGVKYLSAAQSWILTTPSAANNTTRFGVLTTSTTFAYVTCGSAS